MTDDAVPEDAVVETALRLLPVPDHGPGFWSHLEDVVAAEPLPEVIEPALAVGPPRQLRPTMVATAPAAIPATATTGVPVPITSDAPDPTQALVPTALRNRANLVVAAVGVAAAVMVVVAGWMLLGQRSGTVVSEGLDAEDTTSTAPDDGAIRGAASTQVVLAFVAAMAEGSASGAWATLAPASQAHFGSSAAFAQQMGDTTAYATWSASKAADAQVLAVASEEDDVLVVTLVGSARHDGVTRRWAVAFPVRLVDGDPRVDAFAFAGEVEVLVPRPTERGAEMPSVTVEETLVVTVPRGVTAPTIALDGGEAMVCGAAEGTELSEPAAAPGQRCSYRPPSALRKGNHVLTVAFLAPDGSGVGAESVLFRAV